MGDVLAFSRREQVAVEATDDARKIEGVLLQRFAEVKQTALAHEVGISDTRLSRFKGAAGEGGGLLLSEVARVLAAMNLTLIPCAPSDVAHVPTEELHALRLLARKALA